MLGAWGNATATGDLVQLRALDWDMNGPFQKYSTIQVYHPKKGNSFVLVGFPGLIGALTGMNDKGLSLSEKVNIHTEFNSVTTSRFGYSTVLYYRDGLQFDTSKEEFYQRGLNHRRTAAIFVGAGDRVSNSYIEGQHAHNKFLMWDDKSFAEIAWEEQP